MGSQRGNGASALKASDTLADVGEGEPTRMENREQTEPLPLRHATLSWGRGYRAMELSWGLESERMVLVIGERGRNLFKKKKIKKKKTEVGFNG